MSEVTPSGNTPPHAASLPTSKPSFPWVETAILVGAVSLFTISILSNIDVIHHVGTLSAHFVTNSALYGGLTLTAAAALIFLYRHHEASKEAKEVQIPQVSYEVLKPQVSFKVQKPQVSYEVPNTEESCAIHSREGKKECKPYAHTFELNGKMVTLYGILNTNWQPEKLFSDYEYLLKKTGGDIEEIKKELSEMDCDVALKVEGKVIVSATHYLKIEGSNIQHRSWVRGKGTLSSSNINEKKPTISDSEDYKATFEIELPEKQGDLILILGSPTAIDSLDRQTLLLRDHTNIHRQKQNTPSPTYLNVFTKIVNEMGMESTQSKDEFSLLTLQFSKPVT